MYTIYVNYKSYIYTLNIYTCIFMYLYTCHTHIYYINTNILESTALKTFTFLGKLYLRCFWKATNFNKLNNFTSDSVYLAHAN